MHEYILARGYSSTASTQLSRIIYKERHIESRKKCIFRDALIKIALNGLLVDNTPPNNRAAHHLAPNKICY